MTAAVPLSNDDLWLPSSFLTEETDPVFKVKDSVGREFGMFKTEDSSLVSNESEEDQDEFFARLTQRLTLSESRNVSPLDLYTSPKGLKVSGGSPQSILGGIGSWSGRSSNGSSHNSPPATPFETREDTLGLIYAAAGQVERLQRNAEGPNHTSVNGSWKAVAKPYVNFQQVGSVHGQNVDFYTMELMKLKYIAAVRQANQAAKLLEHRLQEIRRSEVLNQSVWPPLQQARVPVKANYRAIPLQRKESGGTGVFIPRRYDADMTVPPRKKAAVVPCALVPAKVVQALNTSIESFSAGSRPHCNPIPSADSISQQSFDALMTRRRALLDQQQKSIVKTEGIAATSIEACLPQEWSY